LIRFSKAIKSKLNNDFNNYKKTVSEIDLKKLSIKKRILLKLPRIMLKIFVFIKNKFTDLGLTNSIFK
jgi:hypothetical protein